MTGFDVAVLRATPHLAAMRELLELLGLRLALETETPRYLELVGRRGRVHLHAATDVRTLLVLHCDSIAAADAALAAAGVETRRWDEAYGEQLCLPGPEGSELEVAEAQHDLYGFVAHDTAGATGDVTAVWYTGDVAADAAFLARYGFAPEGFGDDAWQAVTTGPGRGLLGLHHAAAHQPSARSGQVELSLATAEPLDALAARLTAAGVATRRHDDAFVSFLALTDPDGLELQVHAAPTEEASA